MICPVRIAYHACWPKFRFSLPHPNVVSQPPMSVPELTPESDNLLMEALMAFSSDGNGSEAGDASSESEVERDGGTVIKEKTADEDLEDDELRLDLAIADVLRHLPVYRSTDATSEKAQVHSAKPLPRSRVKKCTYAARRVEAARLRTLSAQLEAQLHDLLRRQQSRRDARYEAERQQTLLNQAQVENERLHAMLKANERRIREVQYGYDTLTEKLV